MNPADFDQVSGNFTTSPAAILNGLINVTAPLEQAPATLPAPKPEDPLNLVNIRPKRASAADRRRQA